MVTENLNASGIQEWQGIRCLQKHLHTASGKGGTATVEVESVVAGTPSYGK